MTPPNEFGSVGIYLIGIAVAALIGAFFVGNPADNDELTDRVAWVVAAAAVWPFTLLLAAVFGVPLLIVLGVLRLRRGRK